MGVWFNDPDIELDDIFWYTTLVTEIKCSLIKKKEEISVDEKLNTYSCYVELLRLVEKLTYNFTNLTKRIFLNDSKSSGWIEWSKSYCSCNTNEAPFH